MKKILGTEAECPVCWSIRCTHHLSWMLKDACEFTGQKEISKDIVYPGRAGESACQQLGLAGMPVDKGLENSGLVK